jgi:hypothetical protein
MSSFPGAYFGGFYGGWYGPQLVATLSPDERKQAQADQPVAPNDPLDRSQFAYFAYGSRNGMPGFDAAPPWSIPIAWQMRRYSTIVLAFTVTTAPILAGTRTIEIGGETNAEAETWKKNAEQDFLPLVHKAIAPSMESLHFGHWLQEVVWGEKNGRTVPTAYKSILPGMAQLYQDEFGNFVGYKLGHEFRDARYAFLAVNESHIDPINGYARNENCREEWWRARQSNANADRTERKASGIQMGIGAPSGSSWTDANGKQIFPKDFAQTITDSAARGDTFTYPLMIFDRKSIEQRPELAEVAPVKLQQFDWGNTGPAILAQIARLADLQKDIMRAWHRPERESMEGQHGTKAEAGTHGAIGTTDSELVHTDRCEQLSEQPLCRYVDANCPTPPEKRGWYLYIKPAPLSDPQQQFLQDVAKQLFTTPQTAQEMATYPDKRQLLERVEIPLRPQEEVDADIAEQEAEKQAAADQMQKQLQGQPNTDGGAADGYPPNGKKNGNGFGGRLAASADAPIDRLVTLMREIGTEPEDE